MANYSFLENFIKTNSNCVEGEEKDPYMNGSSILITTDLYSIVIYLLFLLYRSRTTNWLIWSNISLIFDYFKNAS